METITLDGGAVCSRESAYELLAAPLGLRDCWGRNLDALYDVLTERGTPVRLVVLRRELLEERLGDYGRALLETLKDAERNNPALQVLYGDGSHASS